MVVASLKRVPMKMKTIHIQHPVKCSPKCDSNPLFLKPKEYLEDLSASRRRNGFLFEKPWFLGRSFLTLPSIFCLPRAGQGLAQGSPPLLCPFLCVSSWPPVPVQVDTIWLQCLQNFINPSPKTLYPSKHASESNFLVCIY